MRRSELVALDYEDISRVPEGLRVMIKRSKTDQEGTGRVVAIPYGRTRHCPIKSLNAWSAEVKSLQGPVFRSCKKGGKVRLKRLSAEAVAAIVKKHANRIGLDAANYSGHSLRAGFITSAIKAGASELAIRRLTGHASTVTMERYIRLANLFEDNPVDLLF